MLDPCDSSLTRIDSRLIPCVENDAGVYFNVATSVISGRRQEAVS